MENQKQKVIVILGPTASGKSELAVKLAQKFNAEIISADSRQIYKGLNIGTEKITKKEMKGVKHYMIDVAKPQNLYTVVQYQRAAKKILKQIFKKRKIPLIVGGSGFYIDALIYDYKLPAVVPQKNLRKKLDQKSTTELLQMLRGLDPKRAENIDPNNRRRLIRALEIVLKTGSPVPPLEQNTISVNQRLHQRKSATAFAVLKIGIKKSPAQLRRLINQRLKRTLKRGLIEEVKKLRLSWKRLDELGLEYRLVSYYLRGLISYQQMISQMQQEVYRLAKRQMTWFKRDKNIIWIKTPQKVFARCRDWLGL